MKKRLFSLVLALLLILALSASSFAAPSSFIIDPEGMVGNPDVLDQQALEILESYGYAAGYALMEPEEGMLMPKFAQSVYEQYIGYDDGLLLLDPMDGSVYVYYCGDAQALASVANGFVSAYDKAQSFRSGVRAYLKALSTVLAEDSLPSKELVLLPDEPEQSIEQLPETSAAEDGLLQLLPENEEAAPQPVEPNAFVPQARQYELVLDQTGVLDQAELSRLIAEADRISAENKCDVAVALVDDVNGADVQAYADDLFDYSGYGYGDEDSGILLVVDVEDRVFAMSTHQLGAWAFTDYGLMHLEECFIDYLRENDWAGAAESFIFNCEKLLKAAYEDRPYDLYEDEYYESSVGFDPMFLVVSLLGGFGIGCVPVAVMKRKMKAVELQSGAEEYLRDGSFHMDYRKDRYLRSTLSKTPRPQDNNRSSGGGGGSSMHFSSSGRSHGGRSGSF